MRKYDDLVFRIVLDELIEISQNNFFSPGHISTVFGMTLGFSDPRSMTEKAYGLLILDGLIVVEVGIIHCACGRPHQTALNSNRLFEFLNLVQMVRRAERYLLSEHEAVVRNQWSR